MELEMNDGVWRIVLAEECVISDVEADTDRLRVFPEAITHIEVRAEAVKECDTAYLQMLLALRASAVQHGAAFSIYPSAVLAETGALYIPGSAIWGISEVQHNV